MSKYHFHNLILPNLMHRYNCTRVLNLHRSRHSHTGFLLHIHSEYLNLENKEEETAVGLQILIIQFNICLCIFCLRFISMLLQWKITRFIAHASKFLWTVTVVVGTIYITRSTIHAWIRTAWIIRIFKNRTLALNN